MSTDIDEERFGSDGDGQTRAVAGPGSTDPAKPARGQRVSRREAIKRIGMLSLGLAAAPFAITGCGGGGGGKDDDHSGYSSYGTYSSYGSYSSYGTYSSYGSYSSYSSYTRYSSYYFRYYSLYDRYISYTKYIDYSYF